MSTKSLFAMVGALGPLLGICWICGCASSPEARFFELPAPLTLKSGQRVDLISAKRRVGLLPIKLAAYLNGPQIVTRLSDEEIHPDEYHRWGIPLADSIAATLAIQMIRDLPGTQVNVYPWSGAAVLDYEVRVEVFRFDGALGKTASLTAQWTITRGRNPDALAARNISHYIQPVEGDTYEALVGTMARLVGLLANDISAAIRELSGPAANPGKGAPPNVTGQP
jgi:uncharacterized lipoprotein YmbA